MIKQHLKFNHRYQWHVIGDISFKGFCFDQHQHFYQGEQAISLFAGAKDLHSLVEVCKGLDGSWSVLINKPGQLLAAVDPMSMFPIFYTLENNEWLIADSTEWLISQKKEKQLNEAATTEFIASGFVLGNETLLKDIYRVKPGEAVCLLSNKNSRQSASDDLQEFCDSKKVTEYEGFNIQRSENTHAQPAIASSERAIGSTWHYFLPESFNDESMNQLEHKLQLIIESVVNKLQVSVGGKTLVVPLSGGYDSRLIVCMLKKAGIDNVICFTYGRPNSESMLSKKVAEKLGYQWIFADYNNIDSSGYLEDPLFQKYCSYAGNHTSMPYLQEYFGVKYLKEHGLVPDDSIFLPGHSGDYLGGSYVNKTIRVTCAWTKISNHLAGHYYPFIPLKKKAYQTITNRLRAWFSDYNPPACASDPEYCVYVEDWDVKEKLAKFIFNSASVFPYFGYGVRFPLWDRELKTFFRTLPFRFRQNKELYDKVLVNQYFRPLGVYFDNEELSGSRSGGRFDKVLKNAKQQLGKTMKALLPASIVERRIRRNDWICYHRFTRDMLAELATKNTRAPKRINAYNALICSWTLMKAKELSQKK